jgi:DNA adenine methylase
MLKIRPPSASRNTLNGHGTHRDEPDGAPLKPLLRWVGGKQQIVTKLVRYLPADIFDRRYLEPFAGAASLFFRMAPSRAVLSDANPHLIACYQFIRDQPLAVARELAGHKRRTSEEHYYEVRDTYNRCSRGSNSAAQSARFVYLNRASFGGIFRVNRQGEFNVPYGWKEPLQVPDRGALLRASSLLRTATLKACSFETALESATKTDFVYLDPPYPPLNGTAYFTHYTPDRFTDDDQKALAKAFVALDSKGAKVLLSNADTPLIRTLYAKFNLEALRVTRFVTCSLTKHRVSELVITNYNAGDRLIARSK